MKFRTIGLISTLALGLLAGPLPAEAQQAEKVYRIGYLSHKAGPGATDKALLQALRGLGWVEGQNIAIEYRWTARKQDRLPALAEELVRLKVDLIVASTGSRVQAAMNATTTIPIIMLSSADALENGLITSLARPGGNVTGRSWQYSDVHTKLLEWLHETLPQVTRVGFLWNPTRSVYMRTFRKAQAVAPALGLTLQSLEMRRAEELESALDAAVQERVGALVVMGRMYWDYGRRIAEFAAENQVPVFSISSRNVEKHFGLLAYAPDFIDTYRRSATYVDKILKGAKPANLPVVYPQKFDLIVNLKTAKQLGITIPPNVLYQATKVIK